MPIADLLGVQFDMQLVLKLSFSAAAVLLVSWAYRFYRSKDVRKNKPCGKENREIQNTASRDYKRTQQHWCFQDKDDEAKQDSATDDLKSDSTKGILAKSTLNRVEKSEEAFSPSNNDQNTCTEKEMLHQEQTNVSPSDFSIGCALRIHDPTGNGMAAITGRRSPCFLKKLEGGVGVGRELRQDLEHQGVYSSFLSKAEIKVEDAKVVLEGSGDKIVNGKIYDYYVESSSHSITDSKTLHVQYERNTVSKKDFGKEDISIIDSPLSVSPIIMRDLVFPQSAVVEDSLQGSLRPPKRPALLRKESYLSAADQSEAFIPFQVSRHSTPVTHPGVSTGNETVYLQSSTHKEHNVKETDQETTAGVSFMHLPAEIFPGTDLEILKNKLDLGNCLEILYLAKKNGNKSVQQAALGVMSDNYLQVLRDPNLYGHLMADEREEIRKHRMRGRRFVTVADMDSQDWLRNTAGQRAKSEQRSMPSSMYFYDDYKDAWYSLCLIPPEVISKACAMCTMDNYLFVAVGCQGSDREVTPSKRVFCYNPLTSIWKEISPMNEARPRCKLAALDGYIYAIGGECLSSVERYDPRQDSWTFVAPLPKDTFAVAHHVTVCSGELFVSGGTLRYMLLRYNPKTNTWRPSLMVGNKDRSIDMVAVGRFLYRFTINPLLGVSVYRYHTVARLWYECSSKRLLHCPAFQCIAMGGTVYCLSRHFTMRFEADEIFPAFADEEFSVLSKAKGLLFPFVLSLPDKNPRQTSV